MSASAVACPKCATQLALPPGVAATRFRCPQCNTEFDVAAPPVSLPLPVPVPVPAPEPEPLPLPELAPIPEAAAPDADEPAAVPRKRSRFDDDGEDEPRPWRDRSSRKQSGGNGTRIAVGVGLGLLLLAGAGVGGYFVLKDTPREEVKTDAPKEQPKPPAPPPKKQPPPLTQEQVIRKVKASTVYVRTFLPGDRMGTGSGFFAGKPGFVVTNAHVVGYGPVRIREPEKVEVVIDSGETNERTIPAKVHAIDVEADLALLRVEEANLPPPLAFGTSESLIETQEVVAFGFPFGELLGKNVSVNRTTVSSLRKTNGVIETVQLAGGLNPGNSGGPVANARAEIVGVSVSKLRETDTIAFAVPAEIADRFVANQMQNGEFRLGGLTIDAPPPPVRPKSGEPAWAPLALPRVDPVAIDPVMIDGDTAEVKLPGVAAASCVGGGGRFLIFHVPSEKSLAVFDVSEAKVVKTIPAPEKVLFAAGMSVLAIVDVEEKTVELWSFQTFTKSETADLPVSDRLAPIAVAMGSASNGPLLVQALDHPRLGERFLFDVTRMKEVKGSRTTGGTIGALPGNVLRANPDGRTFTVTTTAGRASVLTVTDTGYREYELPATGPDQVMLPGGDGQTIYGPGEIAGRSGSRVGALVGREWAYLPAAHGPLFLGQVKTPDEKAPAVVALHAGRDRTPLFTLPKLPALVAVLDRAKVRNPEQHVFLAPAARALVVLSPAKDVLTVHKFDVEAQLAKLDDYLFVASAPPATMAGKPFAYQLEVKAKKPATGFKLLAGPEGMTVDAEGRVSWDVPADAEKPVTVAVGITDAAGKEHRYEFELLPTQPLPE